MIDRFFSAAFDPFHLSLCFAVCSLGFKMPFDTAECKMVEVYDANGMNRIGGIFPANMTAEAILQSLTSNSKLPPAPPGKAWTELHTAGVGEDAMSEEASVIYYSGKTQVPNSSKVKIVATN